MIRHFTINRLTAIVARPILLTMLCGMLFLCNMRGLQAQGLNFPVRADVSISQPFSPYMEDYTLPQFDRFVLTLNLMDWYNQDAVDVKLQLRIFDVNGAEEVYRVPQDGQVLNGATHSVSKNFPTILNGSQLTDLFDANIELAEANYIFQVVVYDAATGRQLSIADFNGPMVIITRNEPPFLNLPTDVTTIDSDVYPSASPILFQWTPRHVLFDPNAGPVNYVLEIWGYFDENNLNQDPNALIQSVNPVYQTLVTGGQSTFLLDNTIQNVDNSLWNYKRYAWRVTAVDATVNITPGVIWEVDDTRNHYFSNLGRSEVFSFYYDKPCNQPELLHIRTDNPQEIEVQVIRESNHTSFDFLYREFESDVAFSTIHTTESILTLNELRPATTYELSVKAYCDKITAPIRDLGNVTTLDEYLDACEEPAYMSMTEEQIVDAADESITYQQFNFEWEDQHIELSWNVTLTLVDDGGDATQQLTGPFLVSGNTLSISAAPGGLLEGIDMSPFEHITILIERTCADDTEIDETYTFALDGSNSVQGDCKAPDPVYMTVEDVDDPTLEMEDPKRLTWTANSSHHHFDFNYRDRHNSQPDEWIPHPDLTENSLVLDKLAYNQQYAYTITYYCDAAGTDFATSTENSFFIKNKDDFTDNVDEGTGSCFAPASTLVEFISTTSVKIYWDKAKKNVGYQFMYRKVGTSGWEIFNQFERDIELTGLEEDTEYEYQVRTECEDGWSLYTDKETFTTPITTPSRTNSTPCEKVTDLQLADPGATATVLNLKFSEKSNYTGFYVEYKSEDQGVNDWYKDVQTPGVNLNDNDEFVYYSLKNLYEDTQYDVRITVACGVEEKTSSTFKFSTIAGFEPLTEFSCGDVDVPCEFPAGTNTEDGFSDELKETDIFTMGGFELQVVAQAQGTYDGIVDGSFTGNQTDGYTGFAHVVVPYMNMAQVEVYFSGVKVKRTTDDKLCAVEGNGVIQGTIIRVIPQEWSDQLNGVLGQIEDGLDQIESYVEMTATMLEQMETLITTITDPIDMTPYENMTAEELFEEGMKLYDEFYPLFVRVMDGDVQGIEDVTAVVQNTKLAIALLQAAYELGVEAAQEIRSLDCTADRIVVFSEFENADHFDALGDSDEDLVFKDFFESLLTKDEPAQDYYVPYVAINEGQFDYVTATVTMDDFDNNVEKITFVKNSILGQAIGQNDVLEAERIGTTNSFKVRVPSDAKRVFALLDDNGTSLKLGKLEVIECKRIDVDLEIIPNSTASQAFLTSNLSTIEGRINNIYNIPNVYVKVSVGELYENDAVLTVTEDNHKFMSLYTHEMEAFEAAYFNGGRSKESGKTYMFVVDEITTGAFPLRGYMPRNRNVGFIILEDEALQAPGEFSDDVRVKTIAHEMAHGVLKLQHTWDVTDENIPQEEPKNLMSYGLGVQLRGFQWALIQDPEFDIYWLDEIEMVSAGHVFYKPGTALIPQITSSDLTEFGSSDGHTVRFLNPVGEVIEMDSRKLSWSRFMGSDSRAPGALLAFIYEGRLFWTHIVGGLMGIDRNAGSFAGYFLRVNGANSGDVKFDDFTLYDGPNNENVDVLVGEKLEGCEADLYKVTVKNFNETYAESYKTAKNGITFAPYTNRANGANGTFSTKVKIGNYKYEDQVWCDVSKHIVDIEESWDVLPDFNSLYPEEYEEKFQQLVSDAVEKLDNHIRINGQTTADNNYGNDQWKNFIDGDKFVQDIELSANIMRRFFKTDLTVKGVRQLEHKMKYMNEYIINNNLSQDRNMYVLPLASNLKLSDGDNFRFAKLVLEQSEELKDKNVVLVTIPYVIKDWLNSGLTYNRAYIQPAYSYSGDGVLGELPDDSYEADKLHDFIFDVYKSINKPSHIHYGLVSVEGSTTYTEEKRGENYVTGRPGVEEILILYKQQYVNVAKATIYNTTYSSYVPNGSLQGGTWVTSELGKLKFQLWVADQIEKSKSSEWLVAHHSNPDPVISRWAKYEFKEAYMSEFAQQYINEFIGLSSWSKWWEAIDNEFDVGDDQNFDFIDERFLYNHDGGAVFDEGIYAILDVTGVALSFVGLDFVADGVGFIYSVGRGNELEATIYGVSTVIPFANGGAVKAVKNTFKFARESLGASVLLLKTAQNGVGEVLNTSVSSIAKVRASRYLGFRESIETTSSYLGNKYDEFIEVVRYASKDDAALNSAINSIKNATTDVERLKYMMDPEVVAKLDEFGIDISYVDELEGIARQLDNCNTTVCAIDQYACFVAGTKIKAPQGYKNIEDIKKGSIVWSFNHELNKPEQSIVDVTIKKQVNQLYEVYMEDGAIIQSTPDHPYFANGQYVEAQYLKKGDWVKTYANGKMLVEDVVSRDTVVWVYNLSVPGNTNYYVTTSGLLVHNSFCFFKEISENGSPAFREAVEGLTESQWKKFAEDVADLETFNKFNNDLVKFNAWKATSSASDFVRKNDDILTHVVSLQAKKIGDVSLDVKKLFDNGLAEILDNVDEAQRLHIMNKLDSWDPRYVEDLANKLGKDKYAGLIDELSDAELFKLYDDIIDKPYQARDIANRGGTELLEKVGKSVFFQEVTAAGKQFETRVLRDLVEESTSTLKTKLADDYGVHLDDYEVFSQVQIKTGKAVDGEAEYFVADFVLVKKKNMGGVDVLEYDKSIILETKLNESTKLTDPQTSAVSQLKEGVNSFELRSRNVSGKSDIEGFEMGSATSEKSIGITDFIKVWSDGTGNSVSNIRSLK